jgi:hypothetical protein
VRVTLSTAVSGVVCDGLIKSACPHELSKFHATCTHGSKSQQQTAVRKFEYSHLAVNMTPIVHYRAVTTVYNVQCDASW